MLNGNKKILLLFFVMSALTQFGSTKPMLSSLINCLGIKSSDPCCKPPTGIKVTDIPSDCLYMILQFFAEHNKIKPLFKLRFLGKVFKEVIDTKPCFHLVLKGDPVFLLYSLMRGGRENEMQVYKIKLDEEKIGKFLASDQLKNLAQSPIRLYINPDSSNNKICYSGVSKGLDVRRCSEFTGAVLKTLKNLNSLIVSCCDKFTGTEFKNLTNLQKFIVSDCSNLDESDIGNLKSLQVFKMHNCSKLTGESIGGMTKLQHLSISGYDEFDEEVLGPLKKLQKLEVRNCKFTGKVFETLTNLQDVTVLDCDEFGNAVLKGLKDSQPEPSQPEPPDFRPNIPPEIFDCLRKLQRFKFSINCKDALLIKRKDGWEAEVVISDGKLIFTGEKNG